MSKKSTSGMHSGNSNDANGTELEKFYASLSISQRNARKVWEALRTTYFNDKPPHYDEKSERGIVVRNAAFGGQEHHVYRMSGENGTTYKVPRSELHFAASIVGNDRVFERVFILEKHEKGYRLKRVASHTDVTREYCTKK